MVYAAPTGLPLPLELVVYIVKCCAEYDFEEDPDTRYEYFSGGRESFGYEDYEASAQYWAIGASASQRQASGTCKISKP
jgi:hypothetical protein